MQGEIKVAVTGMGIWSCIGKNLRDVSNSLRWGISGIAHRTDWANAGYQSDISGIVPPVDYRTWENEKKEHNIPNSVERCMTQQATWAYFAVKQAISQANLSDKDLSECALIVSSDSNAEEYYNVHDKMQRYEDTKLLGASSVFRTLNSNVSMVLANIFRISGLSLSLSAACAGGGHAVGLAMMLIESRMAERCIVVGAQECGTYSYTAFDALGIFSTRKDNVSRASRPFDRDRDGLVPSGGAAALVLERVRYDVASRQTAVIRNDGKVKWCIPALAFVEGYGFSTSPSMFTPTSEGYFLAMKNAIYNARITCDMIDLVMAHATATIVGDNAEAEAINYLYDWIAEHYTDADAIRLPWVVATKSLTGHECWMSGVSQVVYTILQMQGGFLSPNRSLETPSPSAASLHIPRTPQKQVVNTALLNSFGFGGTNASLIIRHALWLND